MVIDRYMDGRQLQDGDVEQIVIQNQAILEIFAQVKQRVEGGQILSADGAFLESMLK